MRVLDLDHQGVAPPVARARQEAVTKQALLVGKRIGQRVGFGFSQHRRANVHLGDWLPGDFGEVFQDQFPERHRPQAQSARRGCA